MPEMVASNSSQRFSALLDFQRDVDLVYPSHIGKKNPILEGAFANPLLLERPQRHGGKPSASPPAPNHHRARYGDNWSWQQTWSESMSALLSTSFRSVPTAPSLPPRPCAVEASRGFALTRSSGQFSPQKFIRHALKRAFGKDEPSSHVKRARFADFGSTAEPMVCG